MFEIITDTSANLDSALLHADRIGLIPFSFSFKRKEKTCLNTASFRSGAYYDAMRRGVRVTTSQIPPQRYADAMRPLLEAGVRIYTYTPGFLHAKACLLDDEIGMLGTVNLDYRSLFLHFECNALFYRASLLRDLKQDFEETLPLCKEITQQDLRKALHSRMLDSILRIISPLC